MTISGILSGIAVVGYGNALHKARVAKSIAEIRMIEREMAKFELDHGVLPDALAEIAWRANDPWGWPYQYLRIQFNGQGGGNGGGNGNGGGCAGGHGHPQGARKDRFLVPINCDFDLYSVGPDGESKAPLTAKESHDDIIRAGDGAFVGVASDF
jgi:general secretion pathway protein G